MAFSSLIRLDAFLINSSGLYLNCSKTSSLIFFNISIIVCLVRPVSFEILPIKSYFVFTGTKTQQCRQVGNAVPPLLGFALGKAILEIISGDSDEKN